MRRVLIYLSHYESLKLLPRKTIWVMLCGDINLAAEYSRDGRYSAGKVNRAEVPLAEMFGYATAFASLRKVARHTPWSLKVLLRLLEMLQKMLLKN